MEKGLQFFTLAALIFLMFLFGIFVGEYNLQPFYTLLTPAFQATDLFLDRPLGRELFIDSGIWNPSRTSKKGVVYSAPGRVSNGYTLFTSGHAQSAYLMDGKGHPLHKWSLPFHKVWPNAPHIDQPADEALIHWRSLHLYPNGDLLVSYNAIGDPRGYGLVRMDSNSKPVWKLAERSGGSFCVAPDGRIFAVVKKIRTTPIKELPQITPPFIDEDLVVLSPDGKVQKRINLMEALVKKVGRKRLYILQPTPQGCLQCDDLEYVTPELAGKLPGVQEGDVLTCMCAADLLLIISPTDGEARWVWLGKWEKSQSVTVGETGNILILADLKSTDQKTGTALIAFDPKIGKMVGVYRGSKEEPLNSTSGSSIQKLPGSLLITEPQAGRIFELNRRMKVVWDWYNPFRVGRKDAYIASVWSGKQYDPHSLNFKFNHKGW